MAWEWLAPTGTAFGAVVGAVAVAASGHFTSRAGLRAQEVQLEIFKLQNTAEDRRAATAAKRALYANLISEIEMLFMAAEDMRAASEMSVDRRRERHAAVTERVQRLIKIEGEVAVLGGVELYKKMIETVTVIVNYANGGDRNRDASRERSELITALHDDIMSDEN
ncbi:hypothetical protein [Micromonospora sp. LOL_024]|uniref:hypothetical protein n=1 Tax=Micromonospora sp. LOL_024 TaxID=3345412 RepID=UPI003A897DFC